MLEIGHQLNLPPDFLFWFIKNYHKLSSTTNFKHVSPWLLISTTIYFINVGDHCPHRNRQLPTCLLHSTAWMHDSHLLRVMGPKIHGLRKWQTLKSVAFAVKHVACWMILLGSPSSGNPQQLWVETGDLLARTLGDCNDNSLLGLQSDLDFNYCTLTSLGQLCIPFILSIWSHVVWGSSQPQLVRHSFTEPVMRATG